MGMFAADGSEASSLEPEASTLKALLIGQDWSFVPASDLFLLIAPGLVGITSSGMSWGETFSRQLEIKDPETFNSLDESRKKEQLERQSKEGFDWEKAWRNKRDVQQHLRRDIKDSWGGPNRSRSYRRRGRSPSSRRSRSRGRGRRRSSSRDR